MNFIIPFLTLIIIVVFIHEYGHYYFAKKYGVSVTDFSIGFGKEIFGWNDKSGTRWKICWIPLGGYVKFFGDRNVFSQSEQAEVLKKYNAKRISGAHCYEFFAGSDVFEQLSEQELGTFYLTDYLVKNFHRIMIKGLGLD